MCSLKKKILIMFNIFYLEKESDFYLENFTPQLYLIICIILSLLSTTSVLRDSPLDRMH